MTSIGVSNDGAQVVDWGLVGRVGQTGSALFPIMEELSTEKMVNLVGDGVGGIVGKIWARLVGRRCSAARLPSI